MKPKIHPLAIVVGLLIAAAAVRIIALLNFGTYNFDDLFSVYFSQLPLPQLLPAVLQDLHPPFYYLLLHFWIDLFGDNELLMRLLSLLFGIGTLPLIYYLGKKLLNTTAALWATFFYAFSYFQIFTAVEVRMYSLVAFLGAASLATYWLVVVEKKKSWLPVYLLITVALLLTHLGGFLCLVTQWLWSSILGWKKHLDRKQLQTIIWTNFIFLIVWGAWFFVFFAPKLPTIIEHGWYYRTQSTANAGLAIFDYFFLFVRNYWLRFAIGFIIFIAPFMLLLYPLAAVGKKIPGTINPNWFLAAWVLPAVMASMISQASFARIFMISYLGYYLILGYFFVWLRNWNKKIFFAVATLWLAATGLNLWHNLPMHFSQWDQTNHWLTTHADSKTRVIVYPFIYGLQAERYLHGQYDLVLFDPEIDAQSLAQKIMARNWSVDINQNSINQLDRLTSGYQRVIILRETTFLGEPYQQTYFNIWFEKNGWQTAEVFQPAAYFGPQAVVFEKN